MKIHFPSFKKRGIEEKNKKRRLNKRVSELRLKVHDLTAREDARRGIVRISPKNMEMLGIEEGSIVEIRGKRKSVAIALKAYPADINLNIIRMDGVTRFNVRTNLGEYVKVRKPTVKDAEVVVLAPAEKGIIVHYSSSLMKQNLCGRPVIKGDTIVPIPLRKERKTGMLEEFFGPDFEEFFIPTFPGDTRFVVIDTKPKGIVRITDKTEMEILSRFPIKKGEDLPYATVINVKTLPNLKKMLEVKSLEEMAKLAKTYYINRYEDKKQIIYFVGGWYFKKLKKSKS